MVTKLTETRPNISERLLLLFFLKPLFTFPYNPHICTNKREHHPRPLHAFCSFPHSDPDWFPAPLLPTRQFHVLGLGGSWLICLTVTSVIVLCYTLSRGCSFSLLQPQWSHLSSPVPRLLMSPFAVDFWKINLEAQVLSSVRVSWCWPSEDPVSPWKSDKRRACCVWIGYSNVYLAD